MDDRQEKVKELRKEYPKETRVQMVSDMDDIQAVPVGSIGVVTGVDDFGTIHVNWETGSSLGIIPEFDQFRKLQ